MRKCDRSVNVKTTKKNSDTLKAVHSHTDNAFEALDVSNFGRNSSDESPDVKNLNDYL